MVLEHCKILAYGYMTVIGSLRTAAVIATQHGRRRLVRSYIDRAETALGVYWKEMNLAPDERTIRRETLETLKLRARRPEALLEVGEAAYAQASAWTEEFLEKFTECECKRK